MREVDVAIIGAGTAGLAARKQVAKKTDNYVIIDDGPLGTTCARVGCMPSKVLIQAANDYHRRHSFAQLGINGQEKLSISQDKVMNHVRVLRDRFVRSVKEAMNDYEDKIIRKRAKFIDRNTLDLGDEKIKAKKIIIATGSRPILPKPWMEFKDHLIDTNGFFELEEIPQNVAVIGLGVIGIEIGQALNRIGVNVIGIGLGKDIGGLSDPEIQDYVIDKFSKEFPLYLNGAELKEITDDGKLRLETDGESFKVDKAIIAVGRRPNIDKIGLEDIGINLSDKGMPEFSLTTFKLKDADNIFLIGDVNNDRPILHEAADEGTIAGFNAVNEDQCFQRRTSLGITFCDPNIATIGQRHKELTDKKIDFVTGSVSFEGQGRSIVKLKEQGLLKIYADKKSHKLLGAELQAPDGEHLAHLISWGISLNLTVKEMLQMPFYHPVIEEGLRTALREAQLQLDEDFLEIIRCSELAFR